MEVQKIISEIINWISHVTYECNINTYVIILQRQILHSVSYQSIILNLDVQLFMMITLTVQVDLTVVSISTVIVFFFFLRLYNMILVLDFSVSLFNNFLDWKYMITLYFFCPTKLIFSFLGYETALKTWRMLDEIKKIVNYKNIQYTTFLLIKK